MFNAENNNKNSKSKFALLREKRNPSLIKSEENKSFESHLFDEEDEVNTKSNTQSNVGNLLDNINKQSPHIFSSNEIDENDIFGYGKEVSLKKHTNEKIFEVEELAEQKNLSYFLTVLKNLKDKNGFVKLFSVKSDDELNEMINNSIAGRKIVTKRNKTKSDRENQEDIDIKSISSEAIFTDILLKMNRGHKYSIDGPELNTQTPNKKKTDYIIQKHSDKEIFITDMKSQNLKNSEWININGIADKRMQEEQGLQFYLIGIVDYEDTVESIKKITYYYLPLDYFNKNRKWVDNGKYAYDPRNHFWTIKFNVVEELNIFK